MKILITGGNGFIARNLGEQLKGKHDVSSFNSKELNLLDSLKVFEFLKANKFDCIIHTATYDAAPAHSKKNPLMVLENNLKMFFNITRCRDYFGKMIYFGSGAEFGRENWVPRMKENYFDKNVPQDQYGFSKYIMTKYTLTTPGIYNLRLFAVFGKHEDWRVRFISNACCRAILNQPIIIKENKSYDFLYIDDLVKVVRWFIDNKPKHSVYNVCSGSAYAFKALAEKIIKISGKKLEIIIKADGLGREYSGDNSLLLNEMRNFKFGEIERSIKSLYDWCELNKEVILKDGFNYANR